MPACAPESATAVDASRPQFVGEDGRGDEFARGQQQIGVARAAAAVDQSRAAYRSRTDPGGRPIAETTATVANPHRDASRTRWYATARCSRVATDVPPNFRTATFIRARIALSQQQFEDLHGVRRRALAQLIAHAPEREARVIARACRMRAVGRRARRRCPRLRAA